MNEEIECPYCGEYAPFESSDQTIDGSHSRKCSHCGRGFTYLVNRAPSIVPYRYRGRTDRRHADGEYLRKCSICKEPFDPGRVYPTCPLCKAVVCDKCERLKKPCCDEYARWAEETKEEA